jgi:hypothetical protein
MPSVTLAAGRVLELFMDGALVAVGWGASLREESREGARGHDRAMSDPKPPELVGTRIDKLMTSR